MKYLLIFLLFLIAKGVFAYNSPNVYFKYLKINNDSATRVSYELNIIKSSKFLQYIRINYNAFLFDIYPITEKNEKRLRLYFKSNGSLFHDLLLLDKIDKNSKQIFKFTFSQKLRNKTDVCRVHWSCFGIIYFLNFTLMGQQSHSEAKIYSRIDAKFKICLNNDFEEICDDDENIGIYLFVILLIVCLIIGLTIFFDIVKNIWKNIRKNKVVHYLR